MAPDRWSGGDDYEAYVGRWSRRVAEEFIDWLDVPLGRSWVDVGCGTGALTDSITARAAPACVVASDRSADFVAHAAGALDDHRIVFLVGDAAALPLTDARLDASSRAWCSTSSPTRARQSTSNAGSPGPAGRWRPTCGTTPTGCSRSARSGTPRSSSRHPPARWTRPSASPSATRIGCIACSRESGLTEVSTRSIDADATFGDFDDYWTPFLSGVGPAPGYCAALPAEQREELREHLRERLSPSGAARSR